MAESYGAAIKRLRDERGLSQEQLRKRADISRETLWRAENSENVGVLILYQIAEALDCDISAFFGGSPPPSEPPKSWWSRLSVEQRLRLERYARRWLGEGIRAENG